MQGHERFRTDRFQQRVVEPVTVCPFPVDVPRQFFEAEKFECVDVFS